eukprot:g2398.t1
MNTNALSESTLSSSSSSLSRYSSTYSSVSSSSSSDSFEAKTAKHDKVRATRSHPDILRWQRVEGGGSEPEARTYFSMVHDAKFNCLYLFGGFAHAGKSFGDLHVFDTAGAVWRPTRPKGQSPDRTYLHSAVMWDQKMWVFGGSVGDKYKASNKLYFLDSATLHWALVRPAPPVAGASAVPKPRYGHSAAVYQGHMLITGGACDGRSTRSCFAYHFSARQWRRLPPLPTPTAYHNSFIHKEFLYVFGGFDGRKYSQELYRLDLTDFPVPRADWLTINYSGPGPGPRCGCGGALVSDRFYVLGGYRSQPPQYTNDLFYLDLSTLRWEGPHQFVETPQSRAYLQLAPVGTYLFAFGGFSGTACVGDMRVLNVAPPVDMAEILLDSSLPVSAQVATALRHFGGAGPQASLNVFQLQQLFSNLALSYQARADPTFRLAMEMGFDVVEVQRCLEQLKAAGIYSPKPEQVVDRLLNPPAVTPGEAKQVGQVEEAPPPGLPDLLRQSSERTELKIELDLLKKAMAAKEKQLDEKAMAAKEKQLDE